MRRRLDLAASLVAAPPVLFLDEPTTGLDPRSRNDLWEMLRELVRDGTTIILTTQYLEEADQLADDIVVLDHGRDRRARHARRAEGTRSAATASTSRWRDRRRSPRGRGALEPFADGAAVARPTSCRSSRPGRRGHPADGGHARARRRRRRRRRPQPAPGHARRRVPHPHRDRPAPAPARRSPHDRASPIPTDPEPRPTRAALAAAATRSCSPRRNIEHIRQIPEKLLDVTLQPLMFVLLFAYVFGGAIARPRRQLPRVPHRRHPRAVARVRAHRARPPSIATDLTEGVIDRFRSLPASRSAYLLGHYLAELAGMALSIVVLLGHRADRRLAHRTPTCRTSLGGFALLLAVRARR